MVFRVGMKVICVSANGPSSTGRPSNGWKPGEKLVDGAIYTVRKVYIDARGAPCLWLDEVRRGPSAVASWGPTVGYGQHRFRPVVSTNTTTGMAILEQIRRDVTNKELRPMWEGEQV